MGAILKFSVQINQALNCSVNDAERSLYGKQYLSDYHIIFCFLLSILFKDGFLNLCEHVFLPVVFIIRL